MSDDNQPGEITILLRKIRGGDESAKARLAERINPVLEKIASRLLSKEKPGQTFQTGDLVNEIYLKLKPELRDYRDSTHFKAYAAWLMRKKLIERSRHPRKRLQKVELDNNVEDSSERASEFMNLNDALEAFAKVDLQAAKVVELKFFGGMTNQEIADELNVSISTVKRDWQAARAILRKELDSAKD